MYRTEPTCSDERTPHRMGAGSEAMSCALSTSPTPWPQPQRSGITRLPSGDSRPKITFPTTIITGLDLELSDLSNVEQLRRVSLEAPRPSRSTWPAYQRVGEQLWREGWAGLIAPSAAHPGSLITCVFATDWPPAGCTPLDASTVQAIPPPPCGMTT
jgi:hypothetical protein